MKRNIVYASHRAEATLFEYIVLIFSAIVLMLSIMNFHVPNVETDKLVYSCFTTSYEGRITCYFRSNVSVVGDGGSLYVNGKMFKVPYAHGNCHSNKITFDRGDILC